MSAPPNQKRRRYQFGLATLLGVTSLATVGMALVSREARRHAIEEAALSQIRDSGARVDYYDRLPAAARRVVGDNYLGMFNTVVGLSFPPDGMCVDFGGGASAITIGIGDKELTDLRPALESLPNLSKLCLAGTQVTDEGLSQLHDVTPLRQLDVSFTKVTEEGIAALYRARPALEIVR